MAIIFTDNSKSSQVYTTLLKKYVFPYATVVHLTKEADDFYNHVVSGSEPKNEKLRNHNHVIILAENFKDPKVADAVLLLSKENFRSQITWYRKYIDKVDENPSTYKEIGNLVVSTHGRMRKVCKLIPAQGKRLIEGFLEVYYDGLNASLTSVKMNYSEVLELLEQRTFRQRLTQLHLEGDTYEKNNYILHDGGHMSRLLIALYKNANHNIEFKELYIEDYQSMQLQKNDSCALFIEDFDKYKHCIHIIMQTSYIQSIDKSSLIKSNSNIQWIGFYNSDALEKMFDLYYTCGNIDDHVKQELIHFNKSYYAKSYSMEDSKISNMIELGTLRAYLSPKEKDLGRGSTLQDIWVGHEGEIIHVKVSNDNAAILEDSKI